MVASSSIDEAVQSRNGIAEQDEARASSGAHDGEPSAASRVCDERSAGPPLTPLPAHRVLGGRNAALVGAKGVVCPEK
jgi:hypothetical protein